jgi:hypothetical protein
MEIEFGEQNFHGFGAKPLASCEFFMKKLPSTYLMGTDILVMKGRIYAGSYHYC